MRAMHVLHMHCRGADGCCGGRVLLPDVTVTRRARAASRTVQKWRDTIAAVTPGVQTFTTALLHPTKFSPWQ